MPDKLIANKFTFIINATNPPQNMLTRRNEFAVQFLKINNTNDGSLTVILFIVAGVIFSIVMIYYATKRRNWISSIEPIDEGLPNAGHTEDGHVEDDENSDSVAPANKSLIDLATTRYNYKESVLKTY